MEKTIPSQNLSGEFIGYVINSKLSTENQSTVSELQNKFNAEFSNTLWVPHPDALHITLMDWLAPLVDYGRDKDEIFHEIFEEYNAAISESLDGISPIAVEFGTINVSPDAIFLIGIDHGEYQTIRQRFLGKVSLLPNTKMPPKIIHTTIARFTKELNLEEVRNFASKQSISFTQIIERFRLLRSTDTKMEAHKTIKTYSLL
jgi:2'-5' RNA ligase